MSGKCPVNVRTLSGSRPESSESRRTKNHKGGCLMEWIKVEVGLPAKPEVMRLAEILECSEAEVIGYLITFWVWADQNVKAENPTIDCPLSALDRRVGKQGFSSGMLQVGWLQQDAGGTVRIPNFDYHLSKSAKTRADDARRKKAARQAVREVSGKCPKVSGQNADQKREEQKREEQKKETTTREGTAAADAFGVECDVPSWMLAEMVVRAILNWWRYLEPFGRCPPEDSPQRAAALQQMQRIGPANLVNWIQGSMAAGWMTLREPPATSPAAAGGGDLVASRIAAARAASNTAGRPKRRADVG